MTSLYYTTLSAFYITIFTLAPILSNRVIEIFNTKIIMGAIATAIACSVLDVINNNFGLQKAKETVLSSLFVRIGMYALISILALLPVFKETQGFTEIILIGTRLLVAGEIAAFVSQYFVDVRIFDWARSKYNNFAVRYTASNLISGAIHSVTFVTIGFIGTPMQSHMLDLMIGGYLIKLAIQVVLTPFFSMLVALLGQKQEKLAYN